MTEKKKEGEDQEKTGVRVVDVLNQLQEVSSSFSAIEVAFMRSAMTDQMQVVSKMLSAYRQIVDEIQGHLDAFSSITIPLEQLAQIQRATLQVKALLEPALANTDALAGMLKDEEDREELVSLINSTGRATSDVISYLEQKLEERERELEEKKKENEELKAILHRFVEGIESTTQYRA